MITIPVPPVALLVLFVLWLPYALAWGGAIVWRMFDAGS